MNVNLWVLQTQDYRTKCITTRVVLTWLGCRRGLVIAPGHVIRLFEQVTRQLLTRINFITPLLGGGSGGDDETQLGVRARHHGTRIDERCNRSATKHSIESSGVDDCTYGAEYERTQGELTNELCVLLLADSSYRAFSKQSASPLEMDGFYRKKTNRFGCFELQYFGNVSCVFPKYLYEKGPRINGISVPRRKV